MWRCCWCVYSIKVFTVHVFLWTVPTTCAEECVQCRISVYPRSIWHLQVFWLRVTVHIEFLVNVLLLFESILLSQRWLLNVKKSVLPWRPTELVLPWTQVISECYIDLYSFLCVCICVCVQKMNLSIILTIYSVMLHCLIQFQCRGLLIFTYGGQLISSSLFRLSTYISSNFMI